MPLAPRGASYHTDIIKSSAEANGAIGGAVSRRGNNGSRRPSGALSSMVNNNIVAQIQFQLLDNMPGPPGPQGPPGPPGPAGSGGSSSYTPIGGDIWGGSPPATAEEAINRLAALLYVRTFAQGPLIPVSSNTKILTLNNAGSTDAFIVKYATDGTAQWVRRIGGTGGEQGMGISSDASGNVYATGTYTNTATVFAEDGSTAAFSLATETGTATFVVKYASDGTPGWARRIGGTGSEQGRAISSDASGNVYVTGFFTGTVSVFGLDTSTAAFSLAAEAGADAFIVKYATDGTPVWVRKIGGSGDDQGFGISSDTAGNVYVTGFFTDTATVFNSDGTLAFALENADTNSGAGTDAFIVKYAANGTPGWARRIGGGTNDRGVGISSNASGVYVIGFFMSEIFVFDLDGNSALTLQSDGSTDAFIVKYATDGTPAWVRRIGGSGTDQGLGISSDTAGNVYVIGNFSAAVTVFAENNIDPALSLANAGSTDAFIVKYATDGTPGWARRIGGTGNEQGLGISSDASGNVYATGFYTTTTTVFAANGSTAAFSLANTGGQDAFIVKYATDGTPVWVRRIAGTGSDQGLGISSDASGVYATGFFAGTALVLGAGL